MVMALFLIACAGDSDPLDGSGPSDDTGGNSAVWLVPISEVKDGGPGKDGIPSIDNPKFISAQVVNFLEDNDIVIGVIRGDEVKAYPHEIMDWHEVVNDEINGEKITVSYCPLTGTSFGWKSGSRGFGVSGLLYNANLIMYDRATDSHWSQLGLKCINGALINETPIAVGVVETNWGTWKKMYPQSRVLDTDTGFSRDYGRYPYGSYKTNNDFFIFQVNPKNDALPSKERVYAIIDQDISKVYRYADFINGRIEKEIFNSNQYLVVGDQNIICSFKLSADLANLDFEYAFEDGEVFFKDDEGNKWSIFGVALEGPRSGQVISKSKSVVSYWFAIAAFYPNPEIFQRGL